MLGSFAYLNTHNQTKYLYKIILNKVTEIQINEFLFDNPFIFRFIFILLNKNLKDILDQMNKWTSKIKLIKRIIKTLKSFLQEKKSIIEVNIQYDNDKTKDFHIKIKKQIKRLTLIKIVLILEENEVKIFNDIKKRSKYLFSSKLEKNILNLFLNLEELKDNNKNNNIEKKQIDKMIDKLVVKSESFNSFNYLFKPKKKYKISKDYKSLKYFKIYYLTKEKNNSNFNKYFTKLTNILFDKITDKLYDIKSIDIFELQIFKQFFDLINNLESNLNFQHEKFINFLISMKICKLNIKEEIINQNNISIDFYKLITFDKSELLNAFTKRTAEEKLQINVQAKLKMILSWFFSFKNRKMLGSFTDYIVNITGDKINDFLRKSDNKKNEEFFEIKENLQMKAKNFIRTIYLYEYLIYQDNKYYKVKSNEVKFDEDQIENNRIISEFDLKDLKIRNDEEKIYCTLEIINLVAFFKCAAKYINQEINSFSIDFFKKIGKILNDQRNGLKVRESFRMYLSQLIREQLEYKYNDLIVAKLEHVYPQKNILFYPLNQKKMFQKYIKLGKLLKKKNFKKVKKLLKNEQKQIPLLDQYKIHKKNKVYDLNYICLLNYCFTKELFNYRKKEKVDNRLNKLIELFKDRNEIAKYNLIKKARFGFRTDSILTLENNSSRKSVNLLLINIISSLLSSFRLKSVFFPDTKEMSIKKKYLLNLLYVISNPETLNNPTRLFYLLNNQIELSNGIYQTNIYLIHFYITKKKSKHINRFEYLVFRIWHMICHTYILILGQTPENDPLGIYDKFKRDLKVHSSVLCNEKPEDYLFHHIENDLIFIQEFFSIKCNFFYECFGAAFISMNYEYINVSHLFI